MPTPENKSVEEREAGVTKGLLPYLTEVKKLGIEEALGVIEWLKAQSKEGLLEASNQTPKEKAIEAFSHVPVALKVWEIRTTDIAQAVAHQIG